MLFRSLLYFILFYFILFLSLSLFYYFLIVLCLIFFSILIPLFYFIYLCFLSFFLFLPFLLSRVADRVLVLRLGVKPEPPRWERQVQDIGPPETSWPHVISHGESSLRDVHLNAKTQLHSTTSKLQCWTPYVKQLARQEHKPTH